MPDLDLPVAILSRHRSAGNRRFYCQVTVRQTSVTIVRLATLGRFKLNDEAAQLGRTAFHVQCRSLVT